MVILHEMYGKNIIYGGSNMNYTTQIYKEEITERIVSFDTRIAYVFDFVEAILYNIIKYLQEYSKKNDGFAFFTRKSFQKWTGIGRHRFEKAIATLQQAGLLETYTKGGMTYYKVLPFNESDFNEEADKNKEKAEIKRLYYKNTDVPKLGLTSAIVLCYIEMIAKKTGESTHNIFIKTQKNLGKLLGLTRGQVQYALKKLKENKLLSTVAKFAHGINKKVTHFAALRICGKGVESLLKTLKFSTFVQDRFFASKNKAEKQQDQSIKTTRPKQKNSTPYILDNKLGTNSLDNKSNLNKHSYLNNNNNLTSSPYLLDNSVYLNKDVVENGYKPETPPENSPEMLKTDKKEYPVVNGYVDLGDGHFLKISSVGEFFTYVGRLPEPHEKTW